MNINDNFYNDGDDNHQLGDGLFESSSDNDDFNDYNNININDVTKNDNVKITPEYVAKLCPNPILRLKKMVLDDIEIFLEPSNEKKLEGRKTFSSFFKAYCKVVPNLKQSQNMRITEFMEEAVALALKQKIDEIICHHTRNLTGTVILNTIVTDSNKLCDYLNKFDKFFVYEMAPKFKVYTMKVYINTMIGKVYELFVEQYPSTKATVYQLMKAMQSLQWYGRDKLVERIIQEIKYKLLRMGVTTKTILRAYANVVQCLTFFDSSSVLVHKVCNVIRSYVTTRPETMKTIIRFITAERPGERDRKSGSLIISDKQMDSVNDEYVIAAEENTKRSWDWQPDPYDANPYESRLFRKSADVFSMLVMIYGSKEMFVKEYRDFLAERLMINGWEILTHERTYIEMMKNRFHAGELTNCDVMLKDIRESQTIGARFFPEFDIRVISDAFWPTARDINVPDIEILKEVKEKYAKYFEKQKLHRKLRWYKSHGGYVKMSIGVGDKMIDMKLDILHYSVIALFLEKEEYTTDEINLKIELPQNELNELIDWWIKMGCLIKEGSTIRLNDDESSWIKLQQYSIEQKSNLYGSLDGEADDEEDKNFEEINVLDMMEPFWGYIKQTLKMNNRPNVQHAQQLTPEKLLSTFTIFMTDSGTPLPTLDDVMTFMGKKIRQNLIYMDNGVYYPTKELLEEGKN